MKTASGLSETELLAAMTNLRHALARKDAVAICEWSRILYFKVNSIFANPEMWDDERVDAVNRLLTESAEATRETPMERNCVARAERFHARVTGMREAKEVFDAIMEEISVVEDASSVS